MNALFDINKKKLKPRKDGGNGFEPIVLGKKDIVKFKRFLERSKGKTVVRTGLRYTPPANIHWYIINGIKEGNNSETLPIESFEWTDKSETCLLLNWSPKAKPKNLAAPKMKGVEKTPKKLKKKKEKEDSSSDDEVVPSDCSDALDSRIEEKIVKEKKKIRGRPKKVVVAPSSRQSSDDEEVELNGLDTAANKKGGRARKQAAARMDPSTCQLSDDEEQMPYDSDVSHHRTSYDHLPDVDENVSDDFDKSRVVDRASQNILAVDHEAEEVVEELGLNRNLNPSAIQMIPARFKHFTPQQFVAEILRLEEQLAAIQRGNSTTAQPDDKLETEQMHHLENDKLEDDASNGSEGYGSVEEPEKEKATSDTEEGDDNGTEMGGTLEPAETEKVHNVSSHSERIAEPLAINVGFDNYDATTLENQQKTASKRTRTVSDIDLYDVIFDSTNNECHIPLLGPDAKKRKILVEQPSESVSSTDFSIGRALGGRKSPEPEIIVLKKLTTQDQRIVTVDLTQSDDEDQKTESSENEHLVLRTKDQLESQEKFPLIDLTGLDDEEPQVQLQHKLPVDIRSLMHSYGKDSWISDDVVLAHITRRIKGTNYRLLDSCYFSDERKQERIDEIRKFWEIRETRPEIKILVPFCHESHWRLLVIDDCIHCYDPYHRKQTFDNIEKVTDIAEDLNLKQIALEPRGPTQKLSDSTNCGIFVMLTVESLCTGRMFTYEDVIDFRQLFKSELENDDKYILYDSGSNEKLIPPSENHADLLAESRDAQQQRQSGAKQKAVAVKTLAKKNKPMPSGNIAEVIQEHNGNYCKQTFKVPDRKDGRSRRSRRSSVSLHRIKTVNESCHHQDYPVSYKLGISQTNSEIEKHYKRWEQHQKEREHQHAQEREQLLQECSWTAEEYWKLSDENSDLYKVIEGLHATVQRLNEEKKTEKAEKKKEIGLMKEALDEKYDGLKKEYDKLVEKYDQTHENLGKILECCGKQIQLKKAARQEIRRLTELLNQHI